MRDELRDHILKYLDKSYTCTWGNKIRAREDREEVTIDEIITSLSGTYSLERKEIEPLVFYFLLKKNLDLDSVLSKWDRKIFSRRNDEHPRTPAINMVLELFETGLNISNDE